MVDEIRLRTLRAERGLTQLELAVRAGLSLTTVAKLEQGRGRATTHDVVAQIAGALGVSPEEITTDKHSPAPTQSCVDVQGAGEQCGGEPPEAA